MSSWYGVYLSTWTYLIVILIREITSLCTRMYPKVSGLAAWSESCKLYSSLPLNAVVSLFGVSV